MLFNQQSRFFLTLIQKGNKLTKSNNLIAFFVQIPQLMGNEKGNVFVPTYDSQQFFKGCGRPLQGIKNLQHFSLTAEQPGVYVGSVKQGGPAETKVILTLNPSASFPTEIAPPGLSRERRNCLFHNIRQYVKPGLEDIMCHKP